MVFICHTCHLLFRPSKLSGFLIFHFLTQGFPSHICLLTEVPAVVCHDVKSTQMPLLAVLGYYFHMVHTSVAGIAIAITDDRSLWRCTRSKVHHFIMAFTHALEIRPNLLNAHVSVTKVIYILIMICHVLFWQILVWPGAAMGDECKMKDYDCPCVKLKD